MELAGGLVGVGLVEGVDLSLGWNLLVERQVISCRHLSPLELNKLSVTSSRAIP